MVWFAAQQPDYSKGTADLVFGSDSFTVETLDMSTLWNEIKMKNPKLIKVVFTGVKEFESSEAMKDFIK